MLAVAMGAMVVAPAAAAADLSVAVSVPPEKYFVERLLGPEIRVLVVLPPNADHESYEPGIGQLERLSKADIYVALGHPRASYEKVWLDRLRELRGHSTPLRVIELAPGADIEPSDVHFWTSPRVMARMVSRLGKQLAEALPESAAKILKNAETLQAELTALDSSLSSSWSGTPHCSFLVYHGAWGYFARDYGLTQLAFEDGGREPGMTQTSKTLASAKAAGIHTLFIEPQRPATTVQSFTEELSATTSVLDPMAEQWESNLREVSKKIQESCAASRKGANG